MDIIKVVVKASWDDEAGVWVAVSDDVPGLAVEATSTDELEKELKAAIPLLLSLNCGDSVTPAQVPVELLQTSRFTACVA